MSNGRNDRDIDELEETVSAQQKQINQLQKTVKKMMPGRRDVLKAGAGAIAGGGLALSAASGSADGLDDGDTQWGSDSNRDDYVVDHVDANSIGTERIDTERRPKPGDVQAAIDDAAAAGGGYVSLRPEESYTYQSPIRVKEGVTLDYRGAIAKPSGDHDMLQIEPGARVLRPIHDTREVGGYSSASLHFHSSYNSDASETYGIHRDTGVIGGYTRQSWSTDSGEGTGILMEADGNDSQAGISFVGVFSHDIEGGLIGVDIISYNGDAAYVNANQIRFGTMHNCRKFARFRNQSTGGRMFVATCLRQTFSQIHPMLSLRKVGTRFKHL